MTLPDGKVLELPDGSSALDAARAVGPKLAEQAVLARVDGDPRDLRLPLPDGAALQILTTRDHEDPDALYVLRHSAAHLLAEAVRRLHPGVKVAIGPPVENGFYYDFEFPEPIREEDLEAIEAEVARELSEGRTWERAEVGRDQARSRFEPEGERYKVELVDTADGDISLYTQGDFTDLCRGPHLQDSKPIKAFKLTGLAGPTGAATRRTPSSPGSTGRRSSPRPTSMPTSSGSSRRGRTTIDGSARSSISSTSTSTRRAHPSGTPRGWCSSTCSKTCGAPRTRRGYDEVRTPIIYDKSLWETSGHWEKFRENMFQIPVDEQHLYALKPMNCPGHMLLFRSRLHSYRDLPVRYAEAGPSTATSSPAPCTG